MRGGTHNIIIQRRTQTHIRIIIQHANIIHTSHTTTRIPHLAQQWRNRTLERTLTSKINSLQSNTLRAYEDSQVHFGGASGAVGVVLVGHEGGFHAGGVDVEVVLEDDVLGGCGVGLEFVLCYYAVGGAGPADC